MHIPRLSRVVPSILVLCLVGLLVLVTPIFGASARSTHHSAPSQSAPPVISTSCPPSGKARAAFLPSLRLGSHPTIVYIVNEGISTPTFGTLKRYDVLTGQKVEIVKLANTAIAWAQLSANGQWLLFVAGAKLELIRMDGQDLQTLFCNPTGINNVQWSTDMQHIVFDVFVNGAGHINLLTTSNGALQTEISGNMAVGNPLVFTWLDLHRFYFTYLQPDIGPTGLFLFDIRKEPNQLPFSVFQRYFTDFDSSYDASKLYITICACQRAQGGPSTITVQPAMGGQARVLYTSSTLAATTVRAVLPGTLLFLISNTFGDMTHNGLWKMNTDGSGVTRLTTDQTSQFSVLNSFSQFPWSNISRNGSQYVLQLLNVNNPNNLTYTLEYGSLSGGSPFVFASITNVQLETVGWTTM
ncbi:MAG: hypothetical protein PVS3B3_36790 [Ktedonobacteraceae bacterium]